MIRKNIHESIKEKYSTMELESLIQIYREGNITHEAKKLLEEELKNRNYCINPNEFGINQTIRKILAAERMSQMMKEKELEKKRRKENMEKAKKQIKNLQSKIGTDGIIIIATAIIIILMLLFPPFCAFYKGIPIKFAGYHFITFLGYHEYSHGFHNCVFKIHLPLLLSQITIIIILSLVSLYIRKKTEKRKGDK